MLMQVDLFDRSGRLQFESWKSQNGGGRRLENRKLTYLRRGLNDFDKIWHSDAVRPS